ncbi:hypothetical protein SH1V18_04140 [Vallitalea longa]|uniref:Replicative DNA helicase n=1 Tax=Vallitalea longa TaxID=2936439 RepID=A0A9W6DET9_9FIRM|nr:replicative DNA helicase [Vallitalea longa]GKX27934.1 hypothetical protein SH1V18_04140 [Vallitalea longa]
MDYRNVTKGYRDRIERVALFDCLYRLEKKQKKDRAGNTIDFFGLGLLTLMFFFENMLIRNKKIGIMELADYLQEVSFNKMKLDQAGFIEISKSIIDVFRPSSGKRNRREFYNYETKELDYVDYSILKADSWDSTNNIQYYVLDEQGLELIFATKEYYSEFQISISQLLLRKQLEKGEFSSALRQIDEMRINVNSIKDKIHNIKHDIQRNIISDETYERYKELIGDINRRLTREHEEFEELMDFIRDTQNRLNDYIKQTKKEKSALIQIIKIDNELAKVHYIHTTLLKESIELKTTALESATESLYFVGLTSFNFDQEITRKYMNVPLPFESGKILASPFLRLKNYYTWSPLTVFAKQKIRKTEEQMKNDSYIDVDEDRELSETLVEQQRVYAYIVEELLLIIKDINTFTLKDIIKSSKNPLFSTREFYDFFIILHQLSPLNILDIVNSREHVFKLAFEKLIDIGSMITATELKEEITYDGNYYVRNMLIVLGGNEDD